MSNPISKLLLAIDYFGEQPCLYLNSQKRNKNVFTGILTLLVIIFSIFGFVFFGREMWERKNPVTNMQTDIDYHPSALQYFSDFQFITGIRETQSGMLKAFIDDRIYSPRMQL